MPLRDHTKKPFDKTGNIQSIHGGWPMVMAQSLRQQLPSKYRIGLTVSLGNLFELDLATFEKDDEGEGFNSSYDDQYEGTVATLPRPTMVAKTSKPDYAEYEVSIYAEDETLVAVIELVSASNKDRPDSRAAFASKCATLWNNQVCVSIVDLIPIRFNLYLETLKRLGHKDVHFNPKSSSQYATTIRARNGLPKRGWQLESWAYPLKAGQPLPSLPIWLNDKKAIMLDLEATYEKTIADLGIE